MKWFGIGAIAKFFAGATGPHARQIGIVHPIDRLSLVMRVASKAARPECHGARFVEAIKSCHRNLIPRLLTSNDSAWIVTEPGSAMLHIVADFLTWRLPKASNVNAALQQGMAVSREGRKPMEMQVNESGRSTRCRR